MSSSNREFQLYEAPDIERVRQIAKDPIDVSNAQEGTRAAPVLHRFLDHMYTTSEFAVGRRVLHEIEQRDFEERNADENSADTAEDKIKIAV